MTLGQYLVALLAGDAAVAGMVADRVFSEVLPQAPGMPALVFRVIAGDDDEALDGPTGLSYRRIQVDAWSRKREESSRLARLAKAVLSGHSGGAAGLEVQGVSAVGVEQWDFEDETKLYRVLMDFDVFTSGAEG